MPQRVLILNSELKSAQLLGEYFSKRGDTVWMTADIQEAGVIFERENPDLILADLHYPGSHWQDLITLARQRSPQPAVIVTNKHPAMRRELMAKDLGVEVFLREPFTPTWIETALSRLETGVPVVKAGLPRVRVSMRVKITFPYALLALLFVFAAAFLVSRYLLESIQSRFINNLVETGKLSTTWMVQEEDRLLDTLRLLANTDGMAQAVAERDSEKLRQLVLPVAINYAEDVIVVLDIEGVSLLSLAHKPNGVVEDYAATQGDRSLSELPWVRKVIDQQADTRGDKYAGLISGSDGPVFCVSGPVFDAEGRLSGVILVGTNLSTLVRQIRQDTLGQITIYAPDGQPMVSTLFASGTSTLLQSGLPAAVLARQDQKSTIRSLQVVDIRYAEVLGAWEARGGDDLGIVGVALAENFYTRPSLLRSVQAFIIVGLTFFGVIALGLVIARQITYPLSRVVKASSEVARGNLEIKVPSQGNDEVAVLASAFNYMVSGLQEGFIYRDLLGRAVSPEVREALRQSFESGGVRLEGQTLTATVLMTDIRDFTRLSEKADPATILRWLNEYFGELVRVVDKHRGVVDKFEGDAMLTFFGILPSPLSPQESAYQACCSALEMLDVVDQINARRAERGEPPLLTGIGINTGPLTAGGLGIADRFNYTIIGDTVNTTQRLQQVTREFGSGVAVAESVLAALGSLRGEFAFQPLGEYTFKGKEEVIWLYRLMPGAQGDEAA